MVTWSLVVWVQGARQEGLGGAGFLIRLAIWVV